LRVEILGTRAHIDVSAPGHALHSGILIDDVLFDLGEREYLERRPTAIFITHFHEDHAFFVNEDVDLDVPLYGPQPWPGLPVRVMRGPVDIDGMTVSPIPTNHSAGLRSCAYLVEKDLGRVLYTGDLFSFPQRYRDRIPDVDLAIIEGSFMRRGGLVRRDPATGRSHGHAGIPDLVDLLAPLSRRIVVTHLGSWFYRDIAASVQQIERLSGDVRVTVAVDGMTLEVAVDRDV
jgi:ribonuclease BN (tRNA processing enzyme)